MRREGEREGARGTIRGTRLLPAVNFGEYLVLPPQVSAVFVNTHDAAGTDLSILRLKGKNPIYD